MAQTVDLKYFLVNRRGPVMEVLINRPEARNAMNFPLDAEWDSLLDMAEEDPEVRVVTLRGVGPVFSAGHDLKEVADGYRNKDRATGQAPPWEVAARRGPHLPRSWYFRKGLIAGVHGYVGPAAQHFLAPFDFVIAAEGTRFSFEQARLGGGGQGGTVISQLLPMRVLKKFWLMGGWLDADTALQLQYVQRVVPPEELEAEVNCWADQMAMVPPEQISNGKEGIHRLYEIQGLLGIVGIGNKISGHGSGRDKEFFAMVQERGMKEALKFRDAAFKPDIAKV